MKKTVVVVALAFALVGCYKPHNGSNGADGTNGNSGSNGTNGKDGSNGSNGNSGSNGSNGKDGTNGTNGSNGVPGLPGTPGSTGYITINYSGTFTDPANLPHQTVIIPSLNLSNGDIINVYIKWHSGAEPYVWSQIGATWVGGAAGYYSVVNNQVTITVYTNVVTDWLVTGVHLI
jgi:hypothetical protein